MLELRKMMMEHANQVDRGGFALVCSCSEILQECLGAFSGGSIMIGCPCGKTYLVTELKPATCSSR